MRLSAILSNVAFLGAAIGALAAPPPAPPPNQPAQVVLEGDRLRIRYQDDVIFEGRITNPDQLRAANPVVARIDNRIDQAVAFTARAREPLELVGTVTASGQAFACESDRPPRALPLVRHSSGLSRSLLNQAVYDRRWDWVLSVDDRPNTAVRVTPQTDHPDSRSFAILARGREIVLRFRPRFFQKHRGLRFFEPWTRDVWRRPIVGWCSWFAFFDRITEGDVLRTADVLSEVLRPYGYEYLQIDDGYQRATGRPELWLHPNQKFPSGLKALASYVKGKGLRPGIWTNATFSQTDYAEQHPELFVRNAAGRVASGNWIDHPVDASVPAAIDTLVRPIYRGLREMGWEYFKLDALRHLRYEGYNSFREHFARKGMEPTDALRRYVTAVREEIGDDRFLLACWGVRPELIGLVDGCRIGTDGFSYAGLAQYNSFNNVVWRNDPDHIELSASEAWRSSLVTSLTGSMFLLTDKPERYRTPFVEPAKRAAPVLETSPGQLYDVDPSRSSQLARVDAEVSGRDPKPFDAGLTPAVELFLLEVNRAFESWVVLGRTGGQHAEIRLEDLGLDPAKPYLVFEFWQKQLVGTLTGSFAPGQLPSQFNSQAFVIRERQNRPQLVSTSRHVSGGGVDVVALSWAEGVLSGRSRVVANDPYTIYLTEPPGWRLIEMRCDGARPMEVRRNGLLLESGCSADTSGEIAWQARFTSSPR